MRKILLVLLISLFPLFSLNVHAGKDADGNEIIVSTPKKSIVKSEDGKYIWRAGGRSGSTSTLADAKKAANEAIKDSKDK